MKSPLPGLIVVALSIHFSFAQTPTPNAGFEDWTTITFPTQYEVPDGWDQLNGETNFIGILTCIKSNDAHSGSYAAKLVTKEVTILTLTDTANGIITTGHLVTAPPYGVTGGLPYTMRPDSITGWFKYFPTPGDSLQIELDLRDANGDTIGMALFQTGANVDQYTRFSAPVIYTTASNPDTALWLISSSNGFNSLPNSTLYIDDIEVKFTTGINDPLVESQIKLYPNPVDDMLQIKNPKNIRATLFLFNMSGKILSQYSISGNEESLVVDQIPDGFYFYTIFNQESIPLSNGKIAVQR